MERGNVPNTYFSSHYKTDASRQRVRSNSIVFNGRSLSRLYEENDEKYALLQFLTKPKQDFECLGSLD